MDAGMGCISLTMVDLRSANDLSNMNPCLYHGTELIQPHSLTVVKGIPAEAELDIDNLVEHDSGEEWDKKECSDWFALSLFQLQERVLWGRGYCGGAKKSHLGEGRPHMG